LQKNQSDKTCRNNEKIRNETFARQTGYKHLNVNLLYMFFGLFSIDFSYF
jgi:hypothetical protein